jgi:(1->4)-alpha-D-glucan 1-alpha-D-glucosylmutase
VLSEIPEEWEKLLEVWGEQNSSLKKIVADEEVPGRNREYFLYQTLAGALALEEEERGSFITRMKDYMLKAAREAKTHTFWLDNNVEYEAALVEFTEQALTPSPLNRFLKSFTEFQRKVAHYGVFNSLAQTLLKITSPGVPDFYQGTELWDLNLVDPDNRRQVDYEKRERLLGELKQREESGLVTLAGELFSDKDGGRVKLFTIRRALDARSRHKDLFDVGDYIPLRVAGSHRDNVLAYARRKDNQWAVAIAPRLLASLIKAGELPLGQGVWRDTSVELPEDAPGAWRNVLTGELIDARRALPIAEAFRHFPLGLFIAD